MSVLFLLLDDLFRPGLAVGIAHTLANGNDASAQFLINTLDIAKELIHRDRSFRQVHQMRTVIVPLLAQNRRSGQKSRMTAHDNIDLNARKCPVVKVVAHQRTGDKPTGCPETRAMIGNQKVIVDGLGDMEGTNIEVDIVGHIVDNVARIG